MLCSLPDANTADFDWLCFDASGQLLLCSDGNGKGFNIFRIASGRLARHFDEPAHCISRGGEWLADVASERAIPGIRIWRQDSPKRAVVLGAGLRGTSKAKFSPDGRRIAWGTSDGTVLVAEMADVFQRLKQLGLGWR